MTIFSETTRIKTYHVDKEGRLSTHQLFNFFQEAAYRHSVTGKFGQPDLAQSNLVWMLSRISLSVFGNAYLGEEIDVKTWIRSILGSLSERDFSILSNGKEIAKATSLWACLSKETFKPTHIPSQFVKRMPINSIRSNDIVTHRLSALKEWGNSDRYQVKPSDVDMVNHTNNVAYIRMVLDALRLEENVQRIDVNFLRQSYLDDLLSVRTSKTMELAKAEILNEKDEAIFRLKMSFALEDI